MADIRSFAGSYHAYENWGDFGKCARLANWHGKLFREQSLVPDTFTALRVCLFFEQRRKVHQATDFKEEEMKYIHALIEAMRIKVKNRAYE